MAINSLEGSWPSSEPFHYGEVIATNRTGAAVAAGDLVAFDLTDADTDTPAITDDITGPFKNFVKPASAHLKGWAFGVAMQSIADDAKGRIKLRGLVKIKNPGTSNYTKGQMVMPVNASHAVAILADGNASVGIALEDDGASAVPGGKLVLFDGLALSGAAGAASA